MRLPVFILVFCHCRVYNLGLGLEPLAVLFRIAEYELHPSTAFQLGVGRQLSSVTRVNRRTTLLASPL